MGATVIGWQQYYGASGYLMTEGDRDRWWDEELAAHLACTPAELCHSGIGTTFIRVTGVRAGLSEDESLDDVTEWFVHGDPWHVLVGVGASRIVVGSVAMFEGGYAGPPSLECVKPMSKARNLVELALLAELVTRARRRTKRAMTNCVQCDNPRYSRGCRCDGMALRIRYD